MGLPDGSVMQRLRCAPRQLHRARTLIKAAEKQATAPSHCVNNAESTRARCRGLPLFSMPNEQEK